MQRNKRLGFASLVLLLTTSLLVACGGKEERKAKYLEKGKAHLAEKNYDKARIEFKNVLQIDPKSAQGYLYLGQVEEKKQNWSRAFGNYQKAVELDPDLIEARIRLARIYLAQAGALRARDDTGGAANAMGLAQEQIAEIQTRAPENLEGLTLQASLWVSDGETDKALEQLEGVIQKDPGLESAAVLLAALYDQQGRGDDAEALLVKAAQANSEPLVLQQALVQLYRKHGKNDKAEAVLRDLVSKQPDELAYRLSLASFLAQTEQLDAAETVLREMIAADPEDTQRYLVLSEFLATRRSKQAAIDELKTAIEQNPELTDLQFGLVGLYLGNEQANEAQALLNRMIDNLGVEPAGLKARITLAQLIAAEDPASERVSALVAEVLEEDSGNSDALLLSGRLAARRGDYVQAIGDFRTILKDQPDSAQVLRLLAAAHLENDEPELARDTLMRGVKSNPTDAQLRLSLAQLMVRDEDFDAALAQVDAILQTDKYNEAALRIKYGLLAHQGDAAGMEEVVKLMQAGAPEKEEGYLAEARLRFAQKDYDAALALVNQVLKQNPDSVKALLAKADVLAAQNKFAEAIAVSEKLQQLAPDSGQGEYLKGRLLEQQGDSTAAMQQYEATLQKAPASVDALTALVNLELQHDPARAEQRLLAVLEANPQHPSAAELLGSVYLASKDFAKAEKAFEQQLAITPDRVATYMRLAQARAAQDDLTGTKAAYEQGLRVLPNEPQLMLGMAGVYERQKDHEAAISVYETVLDRHPNNAIATNNLAALLSDFRTDAESLAKAAALAAKLENTDQPAFLDTAGWVYYRRGDYPRAVEILKKAVERSPQVPVFRYHLGMAYYKMGDKAAASEQLSRATDGEFSYEGIEEARAALKDL